MAMTKKDYELVAASIRACLDEENLRHITQTDHEAELHAQTQAAVRGVARQLAVKFKFSHDPFDIDKFLRACGVEGDEEHE